VSCELREEIRTGLAMLQSLIATYGDLLDKVSCSDPNHIETLALAGLLHSFYGGVENMFKRIETSCEGGIPDGPTWHSDLLARMAAATPARPPVISSRLRIQLRAYLNFRHAFRHSYGHTINWHKMSPSCGNSGRHS